MQEMCTQLLKQQRCMSNLTTFVAKTSRIILFKTQEKRSHHFTFIRNQLRFFYGNLHDLVSASHGFVSSAVTTTATKSQDLSVAIEEMAKSNYFTFVILINLSPSDERFQGNVTFLMPNDRMLSLMTMPQNSVSDFLPHHSIPAPLLFDHLQHIPSGSTIRSSDPEYLLSIYNHGRRRFFLNNVKIISPNLCTAGSSIRCHGIDGVLSFIEKPAVPTCSNTTSPAVATIPPESSSSLSSPNSSVDDPGQIYVTAPPPDQHVGLKKSKSSHPRRLSHGGVRKFSVFSVIMSSVGFSIQGLWFIPY